MVAADRERFRQMPALPRMIAQFYVDAEEWAMYLEALDDTVWMI